MIAHLKAHFQPLLSVATISDHLCQLPPTPAIFQPLSPTTTISSNFPTIISSHHRQLPIKKRGHAHLFKFKLLEFITLSLRDARIYDVVP